MRYGQAYVARRGGLAARNADLVDPQRFEDGGRIGIVRRRMLRREKECKIGRAHV